MGSIIGLANCNSNENMSPLCECCVVLLEKKIHYLAQGAHGILADTAVVFI